MPFFYVLVTYSNEKLVQERKKGRKREREGEFKGRKERKIRRMIQEIRRGA